MLVLVHTPHRDKKSGTIRSMEVAVEMGIEPERVVIDHNNEETVQDVLDRGFWAAFTIYPHTKMGNERMVEIARHYGSDRIFIDSSADWGVSDPLAVPKTARLMLERGIAAKDVEAICYGNALEGLRPERPDEGGALARAGAASTSACCSKATPCCAASRRAWASRRPITERSDELGDSSRATASIGIRGSRRQMSIETGQAVPPNPEAVYQQEFAVRYDYPVYFTEHLFARDNPVFVQALARREPDKRHRFVVFIDANVAASWPALVHDIAAYAEAHADSLELSARPEVVSGGEQVKNDPALVDAAAAAPGRTGHRSPCLRRRRRRRRLPRHDRLRRRHHPSRHPPCPRADHGARRRTIPASA